MGKGIMVCGGRVCVMAKVSQPSLMVPGMQESGNTMYYRRIWVLSKKMMAKVFCKSMNPNPLRPKLGSSDTRLFTFIRVSTEVSEFIILLLELIFVFCFFCIE